MNDQINKFIKRQNILSIVIIIVIVGNSFIISKLVSELNAANNKIQKFENVLNNAVRHAKNTENLVNSIKQITVQMSSEGKEELAKKAESKLNELLSKIKVHEVEIKQTEK